MPWISRPRTGRSCEGTKRCARAALPLFWPPARQAARRFSRNAGSWAQQYPLARARVVQGLPSAHTALQVGSVVTLAHLFPTIGSHRDQGTPAPAQPNKRSSSGARSRLSPYCTLASDRPTRWRLLTFSVIRGRLCIVLVIVHSFAPSCAPNCGSCMRSRRAAASGWCTLMAAL
jgi:hypothetical protein